MASVVNKKNARDALLDEARKQGKGLERVSAATYDWLDIEMKKRIRWLVSVHAHHGPKTITAPGESRSR